MRTGELFALICAQFARTRFERLLPFCCPRAIAAGLGITDSGGRRSRFREEDDAVSGLAQLDPDALSEGVSDVCCLDV
jgi:hypothetical protein